MEETTTTTFDEHQPPTTKRKLTSFSSISDHHPPVHPPPPATIPFDVIANILLKLPVKSLLRFKSTCKPWNELISNPQFAKDHLRASASDRSRNRFLVTFRTFKNNNKSSSQSYLRDYPLSSVLEGSVDVTAAAPRNPFTCFENMANFLCGSCDGMFCMAATPTSPIVWNPSTGKFKELPRVGQANSITYVFGYDHVSDSYKVAAILNHGRIGNTDEHRVDHFVHTLGTNDWRRIHGLPCFVIEDDSGKFVNGTLNWLAYDTNDIFSIVIASLDLATEIYQKIMPPVQRTLRGVKSFRSGVLNGSLCIVTNLGLVAHYWVMKEHGNGDSWTLLFRIPYYVVGFSKTLRICMAPICVSDDGDEILLENLGKLVVYNSRTESFKATGVEVFKGSILAGVYTETLISPTSGSC
ncbi:hypothetical protein PIB30_027817 [Stylosanthes scabra]|uniref:F-box domain-containing protein n=1 Tax=Stylosanthes scabra TaxID=79078 RepID=A0ABU6SB85_9FABA|nr:hypothetical protein [Stylosanthes scabra]